MNLPILKSFLVPVDGGESSRRAKRYAVALAKKCGAKIILFHSHGLISARIPAEGREKIMQKNMEEISKVFAIFEAGCKEAGVTCETVVGHGAPADAIVDAAHELGCDMIVMGVKGRSGARRMFGSLADAVSSHSSVPVIIVGEECECGNSCGSSCMRKWRFAPMPHLQQAC